MTDKPYRIFVGEPAVIGGLGIIPDPNAPKVVLLEVERGACHFNTPDKLRAFILDLKREGQRAFGVEIQ